MRISTIPPSPTATRATTTGVFEVAPDVWGVRNVFVNFYLVQAPAPATGWVLVDAGLPGAGPLVERTAAFLFGPDVPPRAIVLTHGHFDHVGALPYLLERWPHVPVYAHPLELPYLTGRSSYPPPDPSVGGGAMAALSFLYPKEPLDLHDQVYALPPAGTVPGLPGWRWLATPGHSPGHVSIFRDQDELLLAGDAFVTVKAESGTATLLQRQEVHGPPAYFTPDWPQAHRSVTLLAALRPRVAATGHGIPMRGRVLTRALNRLALEFEQLAVPAHGRYVQQPAQASAEGVTYVPPAPTRPLWLLGTGIVLLATAFWLQRRG
ncbi:MBL fold metallo-hydrolase [Hymenobacter pini]|uniref:MBL fold metallo-hydrolase n=1 Tax=Hymenobacter pini TaxID=2880879 RepID=UPI001CF1A613|nr:MBL fold metallo-hydrolase [Hymenobacter pini]MCA8830821.1 MBL fold metallo-hydrolase [Hymenobacter pini]